MYPDDLKYTAEHEWVRATGDDTVRIGITSYAQEQLGDIVYVSINADGVDVDAGGVLGEVESTKSVSEVYAPLAGTVVTRNGALDSRPELVNADPYGDGWLVEVRVRNAGEVAELLDADAYRQLVEGA